MYFFIWAIYVFFVLACLLHCEGQSFTYLPEWGNPHCCIMGLYLGEGQRGNNATQLSAGFPGKFPATHKQIGSFWC